MGVIGRGRQRDAQDAAAADGGRDVLTRQKRESCWSQFWHRSILDVLVLEVAGDSRGEFRQSLHETAQFPLQLLAILRQPIRIDVHFQVAIQVLIRVSFLRVLGREKTSIRSVLSANHWSTAAASCTLR